MHIDRYAYMYACINVGLHIYACLETQGRPLLSDAVMYLTSCQTLWNNNGAAVLVDKGQSTLRLQLNCKRNFLDQRRVCQA